MSNPQNNETKASAASSKHSPAPDGKSQLPSSLPDFPTPVGGGGTDPSPTPDPTPQSP